MEIEYQNKKIPCQKSITQIPLSYHKQKLYYAILIENCTKLKTLNAMQNIDAVLINENNEIIEHKKNMTPNTYIENKSAKAGIIFPLNIFNFKLNDKISILN